MSDDSDPQNVHVRKRRRIESRQNSSRDSTQPLKFSHSDYTVGWICALPLELAAAKAVLDVEHPSLPVPSVDGNVYSLGSVGNHNVVIACLQLGTYGTTATAVLAAQMMSTFASIITPLMVGIGGGVPRADCDIRLGDVVISTPTSEQPAVVQHDFGKTEANGIFKAKGSLNKPRSHLLKAVAELRANHKLRESKVPGYIKQAIQRCSLQESGFSYPGEETDVLYEPDCGQYTDCCDSACTEAKRVQRSHRLKSDPIIHYGTIASGNQVIKHAHTRNRVVAGSNILCLEMEAAGLMDEHRCLVIRGICDYCDSHKNKHFQDYAALAAAAVAKEILSVIPVHVSQLQKSTIHLNVNLEHRRSMMDLLDFEESDSRRATVRRAHSHTCKWLFTQPEYLDWINPEMLEVHYGLLWIKGKPGTGKSTIMKFILERFEKERTSNQVIISFFFNARGHELEKSTIGMYRSLLHQLLTQVPELQVALDGKTARTLEYITQDMLEHLFSIALNNLGSKRLTCFVDALDECPEEQIRTMTRFFQDICKLNVERDIHISVLFASRHYPHISIDIGKYLVLENQDGHSTDIVKYVKSELKIGNNRQANQIKAEIARKSAGIFLWVVLVIQILRKEYDKGRILGLEKRLEEIPLELNDLIRDVLTRDAENISALMLCIQWILYAFRPLTREEFYFAMQAGNAGDLSPRDFETITTTVMDNLILDCSKGLAEVTRSKKSRVQFIHETVREFLLQPGTLLDIHDEFRTISPGNSHQRLMECCEKQFNSAPASVLEWMQTFQGWVTAPPDVLLEWPFLTYATEFLFHHANYAAASGLSQSDFMQRQDREQWEITFNTLQKHNTKYVMINASKFFYFLAKENLNDLLELDLQMQMPSNETIVFVLELLWRKKSRNGCHSLCTAVYKATESLSCEVTHAIQVLLDAAFSTKPKGDGDAPPRRSIIFKVLLAWADPPTQPQLDGALEFTVYFKHIKATELLLQKGATTNHRNQWGRTPLHRSKDPGLIKVLLAHGADIEAQDNSGSTPLRTKCDLRKAQLLLTHGAQVNTIDNDLETPLMRTEDMAVAEVLLAHGADIHAMDCLGRMPLHHQILHPEIVEILLRNGARVNDKDANGNTPLLHACETVAEESDLRTIRLLLHAGASMTIEDEKGQSPLLVAALNNYEAAAIELFNHGVPPLDLGFILGSGVEHQTRWRWAANIMGSLERRERRRPCCDMAMKFKPETSSDKEVQHNYHEMLAESELASQPKMEKGNGKEIHEARARRDNGEETYMLATRGEEDTAKNDMINHSGSAAWYAQANYQSSDDVTISDPLATYSSSSWDNIFTASELFESNGVSFPGYPSMGSSMPASYNQTVANIMDSTDDRFIFDTNPR